MPEYIEHVWVNPDTIEKREYQENILERALKGNTLVVLPTGTGKTPIAALVTAHRLEQDMYSKILFMAPTRPLVNQHRNSFEKFLKIGPDELKIIMGTTRPIARRDLYKKADIVFATPQTIANDLKHHGLNLSEYSLLIVDESHRSIGNYAYTYIAKRYMEQAKKPLILALTASPGSSRSKIFQIKKNLFIENVEVKSHTDVDVREYIPTIEREYIPVELSPPMKTIKKNLDMLKKQRIQKLLDWKVIHSSRISKSEIIRLQNRLSKKKQGFAFAAMSVLAEILKIDYSMELLETQSLAGLKEYFDKLSSDSTKAAVRLGKDENFNFAIKATEKLIKYNHEHPKIQKLKEIVKKELEKNPKVRLIVFAQFRDTLSKIKKTLEEVKGAKPIEFIGQAKKKGKGLSQKEQIAILNEFRDGYYNVLCASSIGEEGLDIQETDIVVFYDNVASAIRKIQRCVPKNTKILMGEGDYKNIQDIKNNEEIMSYNPTKKIIEPKSVLKTFKNKNSRLIEITTEKNNKVEVTCNHPILTKNGWVGARNIKLGDKIAMAYSFNTKARITNFIGILPENKTYVCASKLIKSLVKRKKISLLKLTILMKRNGYEINQKTLWGYANRDAIPLHIFKCILDVLDIPLETVVNKIRYVKSRKGNVIKIPVKITPEFMWFVGIIASDGDLRISSKIRKNRTIPYYTYQFRVSNSNPKIISKVYKIMKSLQLVPYKEKREYNAVAISSSNTIIGEVLHKFGIPFKNKTRKLKLSNLLFRLDKECIAGFVAGYFDGDGNFNKGPTQIRIGTASKEFSKQLQSLLLRLSFSSKICEFNKKELRTIRNKKVQFNCIFYSVEIYKKNHVKQFLKLKEIVKIKNPKISYTFTITQNFDKNLFWVKVKSTKELNKKEMTYNLRVKDNDSYIAENIIVHNCGRTARTQAGKIIILITKGTRDEAYYWSAYKKEQGMRKLLYGMQRNQKDLGDF